MKTLYGTVMNENNELSNSQKLMASRIIFILRKSSKLNTKKIQENLVNLSLPKYSLKSLFSCLKELQIMGVLNCEIVRKQKNEPFTITDYFSLTMNADGILNQFQISEITGSRKRKKQGEEYAIIKCTKCNSYRITNFPFGTVKCFSCNQASSQSSIIIQSKTRSEAISILKKLKSQTKKK